LAEVGVVTAELEKTVTDYMAQLLDKNPAQSYEIDPEQKATRDTQSSAQTQDKIKIRETFKERFSKSFNLLTWPAVTSSSGFSKRTLDSLKRILISVDLSGDISGLDTANNTPLFFMTFDGDDRLLFTAEGKGLEVEISADEFIGFDGKYGELTIRLKDKSIALVPPELRYTPLDIGSAIRVSSESSLGTLISTYVRDENEAQALLGKQNGDDLPRVRDVGQRRSRYSPLLHQHLMDGTVRRVAKARQIEAARATLATNVTATPVDPLQALIEKLKLIFPGARITFPGTRTAGEQLLPSGSIAQFARDLTDPLKFTWIKISDEAKSASEVVQALLKGDLSGMKSWEFEELKKLLQMLEVKGPEPARTKKTPAKRRRKTSTAA
jgi:hypothetical protein